MRTFLWLSALAAGGICACSDATHVVSGGDPLVVDGCQPGGTNGGHRWQDLYACYFGPSGQASCGSRSGCHGAADQLGSKASSYVCGPSADACWQGITKGQVPKGGAPDWTKVPLYNTLRKPDGSGTMPRMSTFVFQQADLDRIGAWIQDDKAADD
jgi:hypothetical protein